MTFHKAADYNQITDNIWLGSNMCCLTHNQELHRLGFLADIDLEVERPEEPPHTKIYLWLPTIDDEAPTSEQLKAGAEMIKTVVENNQKVYVHCQNGHGRGPTLVAAYLISTGLSVMDALELIRKKRSSIHPNELQLQALYNFAG